MTAGVIATQWTTPTSAAARPFILWADWTDIWGYVDIFSIAFSATGGNVPVTMNFTVIDPANVVGSKLANQQRIMFIDTQANGNAGRILFHGFIKAIKPRLVANRAEWDVTCADLSELLDYGLPIETMTRPIESDAARIGAVMAFSTWGGIMGGGFVQTLNPALSAGAFSHATVRSAIEDTLSRTGVTPVGYYIDGLGYLHTYSTPDASVAPWQISDTPNYTTTIPALVAPDYDGTADADYAFIYGGTASGTGVVAGTNAPRFPARYAVVDATDAIDAATLDNVGSVELSNRQGQVIATITVSPDSTHGNFDGWLVGQSLAITNSVLGWVARSFYVNAVDMTFVNGAGARRYVLTVGTKPRQKMALIHHIAAIVAKPPTAPVHTKSVAGAKSPAKGIG